MKKEKLARTMQQAGAGLLAAVLTLTGVTGTMEAQAANYVDTSTYESIADAFGDDFKIGVAVQAIDHWNDPTAEIGNLNKEELIRNQFNSMTFGNELKPAYNFDPKSDTLFKVDPAAEELLNWGRDNGVPVRGHCLVWHSQVDPAFFAKDFKALSGGKETHSDKDVLDEDCLVSREELIDRLKTYIYGAMEYIYSNGYGGVVYAWDVVNEATDEQQKDGMRQSYWYKIIGPEFLYYSFLYAREASEKYAEEYAPLYDLDPEKDDLSPILPELFYNDYNEWFSNRSDIIVRFLTEDAFNKDQSMVQSDVIAEDGDGTIYGDGLVDAIGMQGHLDDTQNIATYIKALEKYDAAVHRVQITELDVGKTIHGSEGEYKQAKFYYDFFKRLKEEKEKGVNLEVVTFWGLTDDASWRHGADPLLFYQNLEKKPCFDSILMAAHGEEFTLEQASSVKSADTLDCNFEPYKEEGAVKTWTPKDAGFYSRGSGHQANLTLTNTENFTEGAAIGFCLRVQRNEADATVMLDLSRFAGNTVEISMMVKTADQKLVLGSENGGETTELINTKGTGDWQELHTAVTIPADAESYSVYLETDGNADIFIDDVLVKTAEESAVKEWVDKNAAAADETTVTEDASAQASTEEASVEETDTEETATAAEADADDNAGSNAEGIDESATEGAAESLAADNNETSDSVTNDADTQTNAEKPANKTKGNVPIVIVAAAAVLAAGAAVAWFFKKKK